MLIDGTRRQDRSIELVLGYYDAFNRGDRQGMLALLAEDVVHDLNEGRRETGKAAFAVFMQRMDASYREQLRDIVVFATRTAIAPRPNTWSTASTCTTTKACRQHADSPTCCRAGRSSTSAATASRG